MDNVRRVAVNTIANYIQLVLNVLIGLLTVRFVFQSLGEIDYGIYNLIAGVITLISFISESLSQTSIRFISFSIGQGDLRKLKQIFSSCFSLHLYMAIALVVIIEFVGVFLFDGFLEIPTERLFAAKIVFHCMVATLSLNILSTPFRAIIVAHESLTYISAIGIVESLCKLLVAIVLVHTIYDRLIVYGFLMMLVGLVPFGGLFLFSKIRYKESVSMSLVGISSLKQIMYFAGWTLLDVFGVIANRQGYAVMYNKFLGPSANAVFALAGHVEGPLFSISNSVINSIRPQILKSYGQGDKDRSMRLALTAGKIGFSMMALLAIPILVMLPEVLELWLGDYPAQTVFYARMMIVACMVNQLTLGLTTANQAFGKIRLYSIVVSTIRMMALPISIVLLLAGFPGYSAMIVYAICESLASISRVFVMNKLTGLSVRRFLFDVIGDVIIPVLLAALICISIHTFFAGIWGMVLSSLMSALLYALSLFFIGLTREERSSFSILVTPIIHKFFKRDQPSFNDGFD